MICPRCHRGRASPGARHCPFDGEALQDVSELSLLDFEPAEPAVYSKRYVVRGYIGKGAMARVYLAEDMLTKQPVAVKVLDNSQARQAADRLLKEIRLTERLLHPAVIRILDAGQRTDRTPYVVMEYLFGESLGDRLRREPRLPPRQCLSIAWHVASALEAAHAQGIVHRDVKPDNIFLVGERGDPYAVKLLDFGLARAVGETGLTAQGVAVGTMNYMAPEQTVSDKTGPRTDIYGLGVVLYRMAVGELPFEGEHAELLAQHLLTPPTPPSERVAELDARFDAVVLTAMRKLPRNRYPTMDDFEDALAALLGERSGELPLTAELWEPDVYVPYSPYARHIAGILYAKLRREVPAWASLTAPDPHAAVRSG